MITLKWPQVHTWRLSQHGLYPRLTSPNIAQAVARTAGIQSQVMSAAELAICTRIAGCNPEDVRAALWQNHALVKTWAMRGTLHLLPIQDFPLYIAARDWQNNASWSKYFAEFNLSPAQQDAFLQAVPHVLEQKPLTRVQLADAVAKQTGIANMRDMVLSSSWGTPLKPSAYRGELCFGPGHGPSVTFMNPRTWMSTWQTIDPHIALQEIARRYLQAYGPATSNDFAFWWGYGKTASRKLFQSIENELEEVDVEGWRAFALRTTLPLIQNIEPVETIHLLPLFDTYTIGVPRDCEPFLAPAYKRQVFNLQGWTFAVILVNGSIQGLWNAKTQRTKTTIKIKLFSPSTSSIRKGIATETERLSDFFKTQVYLEYDSAEDTIYV